jgi:hypothetical protein
MKGTERVPREHYYLKER